MTGASEVEPVLTLGRASGVAAPSSNSARRTTSVVCVPGVGPAVIFLRNHIITALPRGATPPLDPRSGIRKSAKPLTIKVRVVMRAKAMTTPVGGAAAEVPAPFQLIDRGAATASVAATPRTAAPGAGSAVSRVLLSEDVCCACMVNRASVTLIPCGHSPTCYSCYNQLVQYGLPCPLCRTPVAFRMDKAPPS